MGQKEVLMRQNNELHQGELQEKDKIIREKEEFLRKAIAEVRASAAGSSGQSSLLFSLITTISAVDMCAAAQLLPVSENIRKNALPRIEHSFGTAIPSVDVSVPDTVPDQGTFDLVDNL